MNNQNIKKNRNGSFLIILLKNIKITHNNFKYKSIKKIN